MEGKIEEMRGGKSSGSVFSQSEWEAARKKHAEKKRAMK